MGLSSNVRETLGPEAVTDPAVRPGLVRPHSGFRHITVENTND
jgi:hypothetical protein